MKKLFKPILCFMLGASLLPNIASAQRASNATSTPFELATPQDFRLGVSTAPLILGLEMGLSTIGKGETCDPNDELRVETMVTPALHLYYGYQAKSWWNVGADLTYAYGKSSTIQNADDQLSELHQTHFVALTLISRFEWCRFKYLRLYSSLGAGVRSLYRFANYPISGEPNGFETAFGPTFSVTPIALSVGGKHLYGYIEPMLSTNGLVNAGLGYRF